MEGSIMRSKLGLGVGLFLVSLSLLLSGSGSATACGNALQGFLTIDRGCDATYMVGDPIRVDFGANKSARLRLIFQKDSFTPITLFDRIVFGPSHFVINGTIGRPAGVIRRLSLVATTNFEQDIRNCNFHVQSNAQNLLTGSVRTNKGCNVAFGNGEAISIIVNSSHPAHARVTLNKPNGSGGTTVLTLFDADVSAGDTPVFTGMTGSPTGTRTIDLLLTKPGFNFVIDRCQYSVVLLLSPGG
jgi:hypothetical protein